MKSAILGLITLAALAFLACSCCCTPHKSDTSTLQGTWTGPEVARPTDGNCVLTVSGNTLHFQGGNTNEWYQGTFTLLEDQKPKQVLAVITDCPAPNYVGKTVHGIYQIEAGTLTLTGNEPGNPEVPTTFDAPGSRKFVLKKH